MQLAFGSLPEQKIFLGRPLRLHRRNSAVQ
jgi:hypothetical protein